MKYLRRTIEAQLPRLRSQYPVLTITGPRQSGKTSLVKHHFRDLPFVNLESHEERAFAREDPKGFLGRFPDGAVIDEIQHVPELTSWIQVLVDERQRNGMFVLTGSRQLQVMEAVSQTLAGRTVMVQLLPFSLEELSVTATADDLLLKGFYPRIWDQRLDPVEALSSYLTTYVERDVRQLTQVHNLTLFERFLGLCAGRIGQVLNLSSLANDTGISQPTATQWMTILEASYIVYRLKPYHGNLGKRLIKSPKLYFYDVGLAVRLLEIEHATHLRHHPLRGNLFENLVVAEVLKHRYHRGRPDNLSFYRDSKGNEIDLLLRAGHIPYPIEVKSGQTLNAGFYRAFRHFSAVFGEPPFRNRGTLVYGGERDETRAGVRVCGLASLGDALAELEGSQ